MNLHIIVPAYNEPNLKETIQTLSTMYPQATITIAEDTKQYNMELATSGKAFYNSSPIRRGKGGAIKEVLLQGYNNAIVDADLAVNPYNLTPMLNILNQRGGLIIANRTTTNRTLTRTLTSWIYNWLTRQLFNTNIRDHQCGFKILSPQATKIAQTVQANDFFFDTELIIRCKQAGLTIIEYPAAWTEYKKNSTVKVAKDGFKMFLSLLKLKKKLGWR
jgi:glycosyltransferase AglD